MLALTEGFIALVVMDGDMNARRPLANHVRRVLRDVGP